MAWLYGMTAQLTKRLELARTASRHQIIFGGNYYNLPPTSCWLIWDKLNGDTDFAAL